MVKSTTCRIRVIRALTVALIGFTPLLRADTATFDGSVTHQVIDGFGVNINHRSWTNGEVKPVVDALVDKAGMTLFRVIFDKTDWEGTNDNGDPNVMNWDYYNQIYSSDEFQRLWGLMGYLNQKGISDGLMPNFQGNGPDWLGGPTLTPGLEPEWAEMIGSLLIYARQTKHLSFSLVGPDNEMDQGPQGVSMTATQYTSALHLLSQLLDTNGMSDVRFVGPDLSSRSTNYIPEMMSDPVVMSKLAHFGEHSYWGDLAVDLGSYLRSSPYPNSTWWMTEFNVWCGECDDGIRGTNSWSYARDAASYLIFHLGEGASAGMVWEAYDSRYKYYDEGMRWSFWGLFAVDDTNATHMTYTARKEFYTLSQISKWVRPGAQVIGESDSSSAFHQLLGFYHSGLGQITILGINSSGSATALDGTLLSLPSIDHLELFYTSATQNLADAGSIQVSNGTFHALIPADCVFTLTSSSVGASATPPGSYYGLFYDTSGAAPESSGFVTLRTTSRGNYSGKLQLNGKQLGFTGRFDASGHSTANVKIPGGTPLLVDLQGVSSGGENDVVGVVSNQSWVAQLHAYRAGFDGRAHKAPFANKYTLAIPGSDDSSLSPGGDGFARVTVGANGVVRSLTSLADGTSLSQSVPVSSQGWWPLYSAPYRGRGLVLSWLTFATNPVATNVGGDLVWVKPAMQGTRYYAAGFTNMPYAQGSLYVTPSGANGSALSLTNGQMTFSGGNLSSSVTNLFSLSNGSKFKNLGNNKLSVTFAKPNGMFSGIVTVPDTGKTKPFKGAVLQNQGVGSGYFLGTNQSGRVLLQGN
jgi:O-glycosyl hydrolase